MNALKFDELECTYIFFKNTSFEFGFMLTKSYLNQVKLCFIK